MDKGSVARVLMSKSVSSLPRSPAWPETHWNLKALWEVRESEWSQISQKDFGWRNAGALKGMRGLIGRQLGKGPIESIACLQMGMTLIQAMYQCKGLSLEARGDKLSRRAKMRISILCRPHWHLLERLKPKPITLFWMNLWLKTYLKAQKRFRENEMTSFSSKCPYTVPSRLARNIDKWSHVTLSLRLKYFYRVSKKKPDV